MSKLGKRLIKRSEVTKCWRSWPNRRPSHGSHSSEVRSEEVPLSEIKDELSRIFEKLRRKRSS